MEWQDQGIVVKVHPHGEGKAVVTLFTKEHGKHLGYIRGSRKLASTLQLGTVVDCRWKARLQDQLGSWDLETKSALHPKLMQVPLLLSSLLTTCSWINIALPERLEYSDLYLQTTNCLNKLANSGFIEDYVHYEVELLNHLGFGLDLTKCGATDATDNLIYVSPKTGRAISAVAGEPYKDRLIELPQFLIQNGESVSVKDIIGGLTLTGYFLERLVLAQHNKPMPAARQRLMRLLKKADR